LKRQALKNEMFRKTIYKLKFDSMNRLLIVVAVFFVVAACQPKVEKAPKIAMEDFFRNPEKTAFRLSPNG